MKKNENPFQKKFVNAFDEYWNYYRMSNWKSWGESLLDIGIGFGIMIGLGIITENIIFGVAGFFIWLFWGEKMGLKGWMPSNKLFKKCKNKSQSAFLGAVIYEASKPNKRKKAKK